eukprot:274645_1
MAEQKTENKEDEEEKVPQPSFKLTYFPFAGRAFSIRLAAHIGGVAYTDEFVTKQEHLSTKKANGRRWSGLPEISVYGKDNREILTIGQSNACLRYVGTICNLYPNKTPLLAALCDEILDSCEDLRIILAGSMSTKDDRQKLISAEGQLTYWLKKFEKRLSENKARGNDSGYIVGSDLTIGDLKLFEVLHGLWLIFASYEDIPKDVIKDYPLIQQHYELIKEEDLVGEFLQKLSLRISEFKMDPTDTDIETQTYK